MATDKNILKSWFETGDIPTQSQFWAWIESYWHKDEKIPITAIEDIEDILNEKADAEAFQNHLESESAHADLFDTKEDKSQKGMADGYVPLDGFSKIASYYLDIINDLETGGTTSLASAETVKDLKIELDAINTLLTSDNVDLDTVQEIVDVIETVHTSLNTILVNDLTTGGITKALTAEMGKQLKTLVDNLEIAKESTANKSNNIEADKTSTEKFFSAKAVYDWVTSYVSATIPELQSLQDVVNVNKTADKIELLFKKIPNGKIAPKSLGDVLHIAINRANPSQLYMYGVFNIVDGINSPKLVRINEDFSVDESFNIGTGITGSVPGYPDYPSYSGARMIVASDGKLYLPGAFTGYRGTSANRIVSINADGTINTAFAIGIGFNNYTSMLAFNNANTHFYVTGIFSSYKGTTVNRIARLAVNGDLDTTFAIGTGFNNATIGILVNADDSLYVTGYFSTYKGVTANKVIKLLPDGNPDTTFNPGTGFNTGNSQPNYLFRNSDGILIAYGYFTSYNGTAANRIIALNDNGTVNTTYSFGTAFNSFITNMFQLPNGKYIVDGYFTTYKGVSVTTPIRLNSDFTLDKSYTEGFFAVYQSTNGVVGLYDSDDYDNYTQVLDIDEGIPVIDRKFTFSETTGKAEYFIGKLKETTPDEILSKKLINEFIASNKEELTYTVATLPSGILGDRTIVTDALSPAYLGVLTGGGTIVCPVWHDGNTWVSC